MRARDVVRLETFRGIKSAIQYKEIELLRPCDDAELLKLVAGLAKQRRESITQFEQGGRQDLAAKERTELAILEGLLPQAMSEAELATVVAAVIQAEAATSVKDLGRVMKAVLAQTAGRADGKVVSALVKAKLQP